MMEVGSVEELRPSGMVLITLTDEDFSVKLVKDVLTKLHLP
jgi:hypothetical protein